MATTTIQVSTETARRLAELKPAGATYDEVVSVAISGKSREEVARVLKERTSFFTFSGSDDAALEKGRLSPRLRSELKRRAHQPRIPGEEVTRRNGLVV
ncbi:MAG: hypothetical protein KGJ23_14555 [Euryarchaeota archaeon]|nr:hypothetical protein [Euryarchaeota archaeon]MDE1837821.1 hypothetical protein [Euryarchaeota archaeon]MDE1880095.1 hypothetical protein [Euryarchaeota archaeon]MDE2045067.1 hypothetical protein [Thermoplasmata archaeon]